MKTCDKASGARAKMKSRARKEATAQQVRGYYKQFAEAKQLEYKSWVDKYVFELVDMRRFKPKNYVTCRWVLPIKADRQGSFLKGQSQMGTPRISKTNNEKPNTHILEFQQDLGSECLVKRQPLISGTYFTLFVCL